MFTQYISVTLMSVEVYSNDQYNRTGHANTIWNHNLRKKRNSQCLGKMSTLENPF